MIYQTLQQDHKVQLCRKKPQRRSILTRVTKMLRTGGLAYTATLLNARSKKSYLRKNLCLILSRPVFRQSSKSKIKATSEQDNTLPRLGSDHTKDSSGTAAQFASVTADTDVDFLNSGPGPAPFRNISGAPLQQNPQTRNSQINASRLTNGKPGMLHIFRWN